jgi:hypothetical protein
VLVREADPDALRRVHDLQAGPVKRLNAWGERHAVALRVACCAVHVVLLAAYLAAGRLWVASVWAVGAVVHARRAQAARRS